MADLHIASVKSRQNIVFTMSATSRVLTIASVNPAKCLVTLQGAGARLGTDYAYATLPWVSGLTATELTVGLPYSGGSYDATGTMSATIIEFY